MMNWTLSAKMDCDAWIRPREQMTRRHLLNWKQPSLKLMLISMRWLLPTVAARESLDVERTGLGGAQLHHCFQVLHQKPGPGGVTA